MSELYLIAHKVRGEPGLDIALQLEDGTWITASGGWAAYPYWWCKVSDLNLSIPEMPSDAEEVFGEQVERLTSKRPKQKLSLEDLDL